MTQPAFSPVPELVSRSLKSVWHPCTQMQHHEHFPLIALSCGKGAWLFDQENRRYLDAISSWWTNLFGHANPRINAAVKDQMETLEHAMLAGCTHPPVVALSERLSGLTGGRLGHCFYASDGASAVEIALKMSFHAWQNQGLPDKQEFICLKGSYHGETLGALSVTDVPLFRQAYAPLLRQVHLVPSPDARKAQKGETARDQALLAAAALEQLLQKRADRIAALIVEPLIQCATGFAMYDPAYLKAIRTLCDRFQVHLIADEIAVGCGRTGTFFACEQAGIWPDFLTLSKGISGGYLPLSLVMTTDAVYQLFYSEAYTRGFLHSHSYTGNPLACRAALAVLDIFRDEAVLQKNREQAKRLNLALAPLASHEKVRHFRNRGMIWACDIALADEAQLAAFPRNIFAAGLKEGILLRPIGNTLYLMPPYILDEEETAFLASATLKTLEKVLSA